MKLASSQQMRELDRQAIEDRGIPSMDLMERAAGYVAQAAASLTSRRGRIAVLCGPGNNGGDGLGAARRLFLEGFHVRVFLAGDYEKLTEDALEETRRLSTCGVTLELLDPEDPDQRSFVRNADCIIDALFGVGLSREIRPESPFGIAIDWIQSSHAAVVAADIPSGVEADTGRILGQAVRADKTVTFSLPKIGHAVGDGALYSGAVEVRDIGVPADLIRAVRCPVQTVEASFVREALPPRKPDGHKGDFGKLLIVGGSRGYTGAPYLAASAAVRSGCGLVYLGVPQGIWAVEAVKCTCAMPFPLPTAPDSPGLDDLSLSAIAERQRACQVLALGPGLGRSDALTELVCTLLRETEQPVVLDADGINALEGHIDVLDSRLGRVTILTPHDGEFARICPDFRPQGDRVGQARDFAAAHGCVLVLKGHRTVTASPLGNVLVNTTGNSGLAKGGSGDVLTGLTASLLCQGAAPVQAAAAAVWIHGRAGDLAAKALGPYAMTPKDVIARLGRAIRDAAEG